MKNDLEGRNPKHNEDGTIDLEINHPTYGWIPFTASKDDCEAHGRAIFDSCVNGEYGEVEEYVAPIEVTESE